MRCWPTCQSPFATMSGSRKREFQIDLEAGTVTCPQGHVVAIPAQARRGGERVVNFGAEHCNGCPLKSRCPLTTAVAS